ncbi:MAG: DNA polymerase/3'-5' exonuclease PolX [Opitutales bacterium]|nr:DNA polymerase/3'-5' exonuclease PolX [Opitutales bacterium]
MERAQIVDILEEIAVLLELKGENAFKIRAYQSGARAIESLEENLDALIEADELVKVPGIGKALAEKIVTLRQTGKLEFYDKLKASIAPGLLDMLDIPGFGPKKIRKIHDELGVETLDQLTEACKDGRIEALPGFGKKSVENLLRGIANREAYSRRHLWWDAAKVAWPMLKQIRALPQVIRAEAAGSLRRGRETVGDLDFIVASDEPAPIMDWFCSQDGIEEVSAKGETKSSIRMQGGLQADLRVVPDSRFVFALHHFTGSKDHNVKMRQRALARGFSLSEWGLFDKTAERDASAPQWERELAVEGIQTEADLFKALELESIVPELREGLDELELAEKSRLPELIEERHIRGSFHNHTTASDGKATLEEMAAAADNLGWEYLGIADHSKASFQANGLDEKRLLSQIEKIRNLNASGQFKVHVFAGCEIDILKDGSLDLDIDVINQLDYCVLSIHSSMTGNSEAAMTERFIKAFEAPVKIPRMLGHLSGRLLLRREGYALDTRRVVEEAAQQKVLIELNANPYRLDMDWRHWRAAAEAGVRCVINPDAHSAEGFAYMRAGILSARKGWLSPDNVFNTQSLAEIRKEWNLPQR